jgi:hypothetical protein
MAEIIELKYPKFIVQDIEYDPTEMALVGKENKGPQCSYYTKVYLRLPVDPNQLRVLMGALHRVLDNQE